MFSDTVRNVIRKSLAKSPVLTLALAMAGAVGAAGLGGLGISKLVHWHHSGQSVVAPKAAASKGGTTPRADGPGSGGGYADGPGLGGGYAEGPGLGGGYLLADGPGGSGY